MNSDSPARMLVWRSLLFVPANNGRFIHKAHSRGADAVILDLEDSVPAGERPDARRTLMESAEVFFGQSTHVYRPKRPRS